MAATNNQKDFWVKQLKHFTWRSTDVIGEGCFGKIYRGTNQQTN